MPKFKNARTGRVVDMPEKAPGLDAIKGKDDDETKQLREIRQKKYDRTLGKIKASDRWQDAPATKSRAN